MEIKNEFKFLAPGKKLKKKNKKSQPLKQHFLTCIKFP